MKKILKSVKTKRLLTSILGHRIVNLLRKVAFKLFPGLFEESRESIKKRQRFYNQFINSNDLVFDVGANIGNRVRPLLNIGARVVAIEPQKECYEILEMKFGKKIEIVPMALGETEEIKDFFVAEANMLSSFSTEWIESVKKNGLRAEPRKIQTTTLNKLIDKYGLPKFIKIDVENYEFEVLKGLTYAVDIISFEYAIPKIQKIKDCINQIEKYNSDTEYNFSIGESMEFALTDWQSVTDFKNYIFAKEFIATGSGGDIYVRRIR